MKINVGNLTGTALDWAVARCEGFTDLRKNPHRFAGEHDWIMTAPRVEYGRVWLHDYDFSSNWAQGGPIIEREKIDVRYDHDACDWNASQGGVLWSVGGQTPLVAVMRCYVYSKLGDTVEVPDELV